MPELIENGGGDRLTTREDVVIWYNRYLKRAPENEGAIVGRIGLPRSLVELEIYNSREARMVREAEAQRRAEEERRRGEAQPPPYTPPVVPKAQPKPVEIPLIGDAANAIVNRILEGLAPVLERVNEIKDALGTRLGEAIGPIVREVAATASRISEGLAESLANALPAMLQFAAEAATRAAEVGEAFAAQAASLGDVGDAVGDAVAARAGGIADFIRDNVAGTFGEMVKNAITTLELDHVGNTDALIDELHKSGILPPTLQDALALVPGRTTPLHLVVGTALLVAGALAFVGPMLQPQVTQATQAAFEKNPSNIVGPGEAASAAARALQTFGDMEQLARRSGFDRDQFSLLHSLAQTYAPADAVVVAGLRGILNDEQVERLLTRHGLDGENRELIKALGLQLPGVQDTIRMAVREVFAPEQRRALTLDADYPPDLTEHARRIGLGEEWARNFWAAHWELPSVNQVFAMLHRGLVTRDEVAAHLKAADYAPVWRDRLIALSHDVFTRVDIRRIHDLRKKDHAWLVEQHKRLGYNDADSEELSAFVELLNDDERGERRKVLTGPLVSRVITGVVNGTMDDEQASAMFASLGYDDDAIGSFLEEAALIRGDTRASRIGELLGDLYIKGRRTRVEVAEQLRERGFTEGEIEQRLASYDLEKELRAPTERELAERDLTRTDVEAGYRARKLTAEQATRLLLGLRYDEVEVAFILEMADYKEAQTVQRDQIEVVRRKFVKGSIDKTAATQQLDAVVDRSTERDALLAKWEAERDSKTADLSVAQVGEAYKLGHRDDKWATDYLHRLGFDDDETSVLLLSWGSKIEAARLREVERERKEAEAKAREAERVLAAARRADKSLALGQLLAAGAAEVLTWDVVRSEIIAKGYDAREADTLIRTKQAQGVKKNA